MALIGNIGASTTVEDAVVLSTEQTVIADANLIPIVDGTTLKKTLWSTIKSTLKTYFDGLYLALTGGTITATLGSELTPALTTGNWTMGTGWQYLTSPDRLDKNIDGTGTVTPNSGSIVADRNYKVELIVDSISGSSLYVQLGGSYPSGVVSAGHITTTGTHIFYIRSYSTARLVLAPYATALRITISSISIQEITDGTGDLELEGNLRLKNIKSYDGTNSLRILPNGGLHVGIDPVSLSKSAISIPSPSMLTELNTSSSGAYGLRTTGPIKGKNFYLQNANQGFYTYLGAPMFYANASGLFGMNTTGPAKQLEINNADGNCLRLTYNDANGSATYYADLLVSAAGDLTITPSGGDATITGTLTATQFKLSALNTAPANAGDTGTLGEIRIVNGFIYVCVATNTWQRAAIATW